MPAPRLTTDEYLRTPETVLPQELVYGVLREAAAAPTPDHQDVVGKLYIAVAEHLRVRAEGQAWLAPIDVVLDAGRGLVVQPDLVVVTNSRMHIVADRIRGAPDLVVEVMSPQPRIGRLDERLGWFAEYGVRECWLVHQAMREVEIVQFANGAFESRRFFAQDEALQSAVLPAFARTFDSILD